MKSRFGRFLRVLEVLYNICNIFGRDLPDMSTFTLRHCALGLVRTYQANPSCSCYIYHVQWKIELQINVILKSASKRVKLSDDDTTYNFETMETFLRVSWKIDITN